jgi:hypothetical protein
MRLRILAPALLLLAAACSNQVKAPEDQGVCWHVVWQKDGEIKFNKLSSSQPSIEYCAAALEAMRVRFLRMGGNQTEIVGAYQGNFLFLQNEGIFTSDTLTGGRYLALVRTGDGRLAQPGAVSSQ